jgi:predicted amidophosphoribosyltransferase
MLRRRCLLRRHQSRPARRTSDYYPNRWEEVVNRLCNHCGSPLQQEVDVDKFCDKCFQPKPAPHQQVWAVGKKVFCSTTCQAYLDEVKAERQRKYDMFIAPYLAKKEAERVLGEQYHLPFFGGDP